MLIESTSSFYFLFELKKLILWGQQRKIAKKQVLNKIP